MDQVGEEEEEEEKNGIVIDQGQIRAQLPTNALIRTLIRQTNDYARFKRG